MEQLFLICPSRRILISTVLTFNPPPKKSTYQIVASELNGIVLKNYLIYDTINMYV